MIPTMIANLPCKNKQYHQVAIMQEKRKSIYQVYNYDVFLTLNQTPNIQIIQIIYNLQK